MWQFGSITHSYVPAASDGAVPGLKILLHVGFPLWHTWPYGPPRYPYTWLR